jgi:hypothetical protein
LEKFWKDIEFKVVSKEFESRDQAKLWIIANQLSRRNLGPEQISYLRGIRYNLEKSIQGKHTGSGLSAEKISSEYGVTGRTIRNDAKFAEAVDKLSPEE